MHRKTLAIMVSLIALSASPPLLAEREAFAIDNKTYQSEYGSCHVAYPPALLPARSWLAIIDGLDRHFGANAAIDAKTATELRAYLSENAGRDRAGARPVLRITETAWFKREHREVPASVWTRASVKSAANCGACHRGAENGSFNESSIRIPKRGQSWKRRAKSWYGTHRPECFTGRLHCPSRAHS